MIIRSGLAALAVTLTLASSPAHAGGGLLTDACLAAPPPSVQSVLSFSVEPGGTIVITGANFFGPVQGQIFIHLIDFMHNPLTQSLQINFWTDSAVGGTINPPPPQGTPPGIPPPGLAELYGVLSQPATFQVVTWCGQSIWASGSLSSVPFTPAMDIKPLPFTSVTCSMTSNNSGDSCLDGGGRWPAECAFPWGGIGALGTGTALIPSVGFFAAHNSGWGGGNGGADVFTANLINQWSVEAITGFTVNPMHVDGSPDNDPQMQASLTFAAGPQNNWAVHWHQHECSVLEYDGLVSVTGPIGTPFSGPP